MGVITQSDSNFCQ